ncbi:GntR family transcriptional regulator [Microbacterium betulae]|uniref:GntR family transcriptional regulator n=1 Tax=Microbacterium betulae TaxID=2981139 RepID=A0AA97FL01_9MICO|nr:GntR family transcriptional regulator [Microbacterium sp. AB]WOF23377.1 GntR family transcriptional regulator [Microbacterium sp. AB]
MSGVETLSAINSRPTAVIIADQLRERIIDGSFGPGDQINEAQVAAQLNVSRGPVREGLHRLVQEGLLLSRPNRGVFVRDLTARDVAEVYEAREVIECAAAEVITRRALDARRRTVERLTPIIDRMTPYADARDWRGLGRIDLEFHTTLVEEAGNTRLVRAYSTLATEALICMSHADETYPDPDRVDADHREIASLLRDGDMTAVHLALHRHLSLDNHQLHDHDDDGDLRHGRPEERAAPVRAGSG